MLHGGRDVAKRSYLWSVTSDQFGHRLGCATCASTTLRNWSLVTGHWSLEKAMAQIDSLFHEMRDRSASDLHVVIGRPPMFRQSGDMVESEHAVVPINRAPASSVQRSTRIETAIISASHSPG